MILRKTCAILHLFVEHPGDFGIHTPKVVTHTLGKSEYCVDKVEHCVVKIENVGDTKKNMCDTTPICRASASLRCSYFKRWTSYSS